MIRADELLRFDALDNLIDFVEAYPTLAIEAVRDSFERNIKPHLLDELRTYPNRLPSSPFIWSLDPQAQRRAQRGYHARVRSGEIQTSNGHYVRTGQTAAGWDVDVIVGDGSIVMAVENKATGRVKRGMMYTTGKRQVPSHAATGWVRSTRTIAFWAEAARDDATEAIKKLLRGR